jgi:cytochrome oxidase Cu insertion factor (SCO1/SenC/PrrC family)
MADVTTEHARGTGTEVSHAPDAPHDSNASDPVEGPAASSADGARPAAPTASPAPVFPRRMVNAIVAAVVALVLLTVVINRVASSVGGPATTTSTTTVHRVIGGTAPPPASTELHAPLRDLLGLTTLLGHHRAAGFSLTDAATGRAVSVASLRGQVVVLTFADATCKDICPILAAELRVAATDLEKSSVRATFVTVNTDPLATSPKDATILNQPLLASIPGWMFLTGPVKTLNHVWTDYGISITVNRTTKAVSHNDLLYFVRKNGSLAWTAIPFADQSRGGTYSLPQAVIDRFGAGIAKYARSLAK